MDYQIVPYIKYLVLAVMLCIWVVRALFRNDRVFLNNVFAGNMEAASAVNNLLYVSFYLVNLGYTVYSLRVAMRVSDTVSLLEVLSMKVGAITLILGGMHFFNMYLFFRLRKHARWEMQRYTHEQLPYRRNDPSVA